jgi:hypothetical protein
MLTNDALNKITVAKLFTGSFGKKGCLTNCPGCFLGTYDSLCKPKHQGTMIQIVELVSLLPNLKSIMLYGNPDISIDTQFCNEIVKYIQGIRQIKR